MSWKHKYKWFIQYPGQGYTEVTPDYSDIEWQDSRFKSAFFIKELSSEVTFTGADFKAIWELEQSGEACKHVLLKLQKRCGCDSETYIDYWYGYAKFIKGDWDAYRQRVTFKPETTNPFSEVIEGWAGTVDLLTLPLQRVQTYKEAEVVYYVEGVGVTNSPLSPDVDGVSEIVGQWDTGYRGTYTTGGSFNPVGIVYGHIRSVVRYTGAGVPVGDWTLNATDGMYYRRPYTRLAYAYDTNYFNDRVAGLAELLEDKVIERLRITFNFDRGNGVLVRDAVAAVFSGFDIISNFYNINADGSNPENTAYDFATAYIHDALLFRESTLLNPDASDLATTLPVERGKFIEDMLKLHLEIWYDAGTDKLHIEHISYTRYQKGADLIETRYDEIKESGFKYTYDETDFPRSESFRWAKDEEVYKIDYNPKCTIDDPDDIPFSLSSGNLLYLYENEKLSDTGGFCYVAQNDGEVYAEFITESIRSIRWNGYLGGFETYYVEVVISKINEPFRIVNIAEAVFFWNRPLLIATVGDNELAMRSKKPNRSHEIIITMNCNNYDNDYAVTKKYKTQLGWGTVDKALYSERSNLLTLTLKY